MAKLKRKVIVTTVRYEETEELTEQQIQNWESENDELQEEVMDEVEFELVHDKVMEDSEWPELTEE
tara:strand:+ start:141 stop:338 length:198 start_codon:yes stop_codon:yes gene_type:complete